MTRFSTRLLAVLMLLLTGFAVLVAWGVGWDLAQRLEEQGRSYIKVELAALERQFFDLAVVEEYAAAVQRLQLFCDTNPEVWRLQVATAQGNAFFQFERPLAGRQESFHRTLSLGPGEAVDIELTTSLAGVDALAADARRKVLIALLLVIAPLGLGMWLVVRRLALMPMERAQLDQLHDLIDLIPHPVCVCNSQGRPWLSNQACDAAMRGQVPEGELDQQVLARGQALTLPEEISFLTPEGERLYQISKIPFVSVSQREPSVLTLALDLTERKRIERALVESEERLRKIFELGLIGMAITSPGKGWLEFNDTLCAMFGYSRGEFADLTWAEITHPDDLSADLTRFNRVLAGEIDGYALEKRFIHKNGMIVHAEIAAHALRKEDGSLDYFVALVHDRTRHKQAEAALKESEAKYRRIFESIEDGYILAGMDGVIRSVNPATARILGYAGPEELEGKRITQEIFACPAEREAMTKALVEHGALNGYLLHFTRRDGRIITTDCNLHLLNDAAQQPFLVEGTFRDVSEREQLVAEKQKALESAKAASHAKSEFLATMSHEIRTPLNAILGMGELLQESPLTPDQASYLKTLNRSGEALLSLINDILDLSKIEAGELVLERTVFDLRHWFDESVEAFSYAAKEKSIGYVARLAEETPRLVRGDPVRLRQVLLNLISNAIKFTSEGEVAVRVDREENGIILFSVIDTGAGIAPELRDLIFRPFTQADSSITRKFGGTGLGLTICQRLVDLMGGDIELRSAPGQGSVFSVRAPLPQVEDQSLEKARTPPGTAGALDNAFQKTSAWEGLRILLVDDSEDNRRLVEAFLKQTAHQLIMATDGGEAVALFRENRFNLIFMDIQMPGMDGYEATRRIRALEASNGVEPTPIVALTAHAMAEESEQIIAAGCDLHLTKPIRKKRLLDTIARFTPQGCLNPTHRALGRRRPVEAM